MNEFIKMATIFVENTYDITLETNVWRLQVKKFAIDG